MKDEERNESKLMRKRSSQRVKRKRNRYIDVQIEKKQRMEKRERFVKCISRSKED